MGLDDHSLVEDDLRPPSTSLQIVVDYHHHRNEFRRKGI